MPDYYVHGGGVRAISVAVGTIALLQAVGFDKSWSDTVTIAGGALIGLILEPDLDIDNGLLLFHEMERGKVIGWALGHFFQAYWWPYAKTIHHRSMISHAPVLSTLIRLAYVTPLVLVTVYGLNLLSSLVFGEPLWPLFITQTSTLLWVGVRLVIGLMLADICHFSLDWAHGQFGKDNRHDI